MSHDSKTSRNSEGTSTRLVQRERDANLLRRGARPRPVMRGPIGWEASYRRRDDGRGTSEIPEVLRGLVGSRTSGQVTR